MSSDREGFVPEPGEFITVGWPLIDPEPPAAEESTTPEDWDCGDSDCRACRRNRK